jgi:hypothetical protein
MRRNIALIAALTIISTGFGSEVAARGYVQQFPQKYTVENHVKVYRNGLSPAQQHAYDVHMQYEIRAEEIRRQQAEQAMLSSLQNQRNRDLAFQKGFVQGFDKGRAEQTNALRERCLGNIRPKYRRSRRHHNARLGCSQFYNRPIRMRQRIRSSPQSPR